MENKFTRRNIIASGAALIGSLLVSNRVSANASSGLANETTRQSDNNLASATIKTRVASCNCGQLSATVVGPDPERISLCHCPLCQKQSGSAIAIQARFPKEQVTIAGKSKVWEFPIKGAEPVSYRNCASGGAKFHFCDSCGSTVYYTSNLDSARIGIKIGTFADPSFPAPKVTGFEEYSHPWVMNIKKLAMKVLA